jgi:hypothetical protein
VRTQEELNDPGLLEAAAQAARLQLRYARQGTSLALAAMAGARECEALRHYPRNDVVDRAAHTRFYYHAHTSRRRPADEHGHFHLFMYDARAPARFCHLAGLSLDARGQALRWFTTNRWVTGEHWQDADHLVRELSHFSVSTHGRMAPVALWLTAMVRLFAPQIATLVRRRDAVMARRHALQGDAAFEDRRLDVITECAASLPQRIMQLGR